MIPGPLGLGPWLEQSLGTSSSPFHFECMIDKLIPIMYDLVKDTFTHNSP